MTKAELQEVIEPLKSDVKELKSELKIWFLGMSVTIIVAIAGIVGTFATIVSLIALK